MEIATDKVDSDITSEYEGVLIERKFNKDDVIKVGDVIAVIESPKSNEKNIKEKDDIAKFDIKNDNYFNSEIKEDDDQLNYPDLEPESNIIESQIEEIIDSINDGKKSDTEYKQKIDTNKFLSPLVKSIAQEEGISDEELEKIPGTGASNLSLIHI